MVHYQDAGSAKAKGGFFRTTSGREPVREWLLSLDKAERRQVGMDIAYVQFKWPIGKPRVDHLRASIWEVRSRLETRIARTLFAVDSGEMVLLYGFVKKTQKTSNNDIELADGRWKEWKNAQGK